MKISSNIDQTPFIVFSTESLGRQLILGQGKEKYLSLLSFSTLKPEHAERTKMQAVILFEQSEEVAQYLREGENFNFVPHIFPIEEALRKVQNAL